MPNRVDTIKTVVYYIIVLKIELSKNKRFEYHKSTANREERDVVPDVIRLGCRAPEEDSNYKSESTRYRDREELQERRSTKWQKGTRNLMV